MKVKVKEINNTDSVDTQGNVVKCLDCGAVLSNDEKECHADLCFDCVCHRGE